MSVIDVDDIKTFFYYLKIVITKNGVAEEFSTFIFNVTSVNISSEFCPGSKKTAYEQFLENHPVYTLGHI